MDESETSFESLGLNKALCNVCEHIEWRVPTQIQKEVIPMIIKGEDLVGIAETGSGKTGAYALPILQSLLSGQAVKFFCLVLVPSRELALQVFNTFEKLGKPINAQAALLVGKTDVATQTKSLYNKPHILIATPGRLLHLLKEVPSFSLNSLKYIVFDEADKLMESKFGTTLEELFEYLPKTRRTLLFSATMTPNVEALKSLVLCNPLLVQINSTFVMPITLEHYYVKVTESNKDLYLTDILFQLPFKSVIIFCKSGRESLRIAYLLNLQSFAAFPLNSKMTQPNRDKVLIQFRKKNARILVATDILSRGMDLDVDLIINYNVPSLPIIYVHRAGRTARAGKEGIAMSFVSPYEVKDYLEIENSVNEKFPRFQMKERTTLLEQYGDRFKKIKDLSIKKIEDKFPPGEDNDHYKIDIFEDDSWDSQHLVLKLRYKRQRKD